MLSHDEKRELLTIAREAIACALQGKRRHLPTATTDGLKQACGAFVTIKIEHDLRGCIGYIESEKPLAEVVGEVAVKAATDDPRFPPMTLHELHTAEIEISVLSPLQRIRSVDEIEVGKHGLVVALGARRGLLLPQVATEHRLSREAFFEATMRKAGLPPTLWRIPETELSVFEAEVVHETDVLHEEGEA